MPNRALYFAKTLLALCAALACASVSVFAIVATRDMETARTQAAGVVTKLNLELDEVHRLTLEAGLTAMEARKASAKEAAYLDQQNAAWNQLIARTNALLATASSAVAQTGTNETELVQSSKATLATLQQTIGSAQPALVSLNDELGQLQDATTNLDELISDPNIGRTLADFATTANNAAVISTDGREVVERYAHPTKKKLGFWGGLFAAARVVQKVSPPLF
jgi:hypothetical protein